MFNNRVQELEARYDGAIPRDLLAHAIRLDREQPLAAVPPAPRPIPPRFPTDGHLVAAMADEMVRRLAGTGACEERDLFAAGFSLLDLERHGPAARTRAADLMAPRQIAYETYVARPRRGGRSGPKVHPNRRRREDRLGDEAR